ncbi:MAG: hypothetical protein K2P57_02390 [Burkholderiales bacterium]|nr:hypothetical protein [Burkholderiales bacterium]
MANLTPQQLASMSPDQLFAQLGTEKVANMHAVLGNLNLAEDAQIFADQDTTDEGESFFDNLNETAYNFFCGNNANEDSLSHLLSAFNIGKNAEAVISAVAGVLTANLGWGALVAGIVAALLVKVVFPAGYDSLCKDWKDSMS